MPEELSQYDLGAALSRIDVNLEYLKTAHELALKRVAELERFKSTTQNHMSWIKGLLAPLAILWPLAVDYLKMKWGS